MKKMLIILLILCLGAGYSCSIDHVHKINVNKEYYYHGYPPHHHHRPPKHDHHDHHDDHQEHRKH